MSVVEPVFGNIGTAKKLNRFSLRGKAKVQGQWQLYCTLHSPEILPYEIGNALSAIVKRKQLTQNEAMQAIELAQAIPVRLVQVDINKALELALKFNIYAYDAYFLQCALSLSCSLLTLDKKMKEVAKQLNIVVLE
ncbi:VapC toxin [Oleiphilus messinensis]|uniref:VapC toxin n=2 Tax=Oleiphilus messinensis TaxID=141451 RepID=A0A1Y0ICY0_9GAMM|nr:VapC toxin [Oleiphilus messinensis]